MIGRKRLSDFTMSAIAISYTVLYYNLPVCYYCRRTFSSHFSVTHTTLQGAQHSALEKSTCPTRCNNVITLCVRQTPKPKSSLLPFKKYPTPSRPLFLATLPSTIMQKILAKPNHFKPFSAGSCKRGAAVFDEVD